MYTSGINPKTKTKKELKERVAAGECIRIYQPGPFGTGCLRAAGKYAVEGPHYPHYPHYPQPHKWYATVTLDDQGFITEVK